MAYMPNFMIKNLALQARCGSNYLQDFENFPLLFGGLDRKKKG